MRDDDANNKRISSLSLTRDVGLQVPSLALRVLVARPGVSLLLLYKVEEIIRARTVASALDLLMETVQEKKKLFGLTQRALVAEGDQ